jgi:hypothetical protein
MRARLRDILQLDQRQQIAARDGASQTRAGRDIGDGLLWTIFRELIEESRKIEGNR